MSTERPILRAATVLLVRDAPQGEKALEVLMVRRSSAVAFGADAWVFPGGKVAEADAEDAWETFVDGSFTRAERALRIAAARETFEESGLLLARDGSGRFVGAELCELLGPRRKDVEKTPRLFLELVREAGVKLALDRLVYFAHWITPSFEPRRFDTHFFLAAAPAEQIAAHDGWEAVEHGWAEPQELLQRRLDGKAKLMFPTRLNLEVLAAGGSAAAVEAAARAKTVVTVEPQVIERDGVRVLKIPAEAGYSVVEETMDRVMG